MKLYGYFRSSAAYRVRIALNLKGLCYDAVPIHLMRGGGETEQRDRDLEQRDGTDPDLGAVGFEGGQDVGHGAQSPRSR